MKFDQRRVWVAAFVTACLSASPALAQSSGRCDTGTRSQDVSELDLEALLNTKIITVSRFAETESAAPGVISVVSHDEIRRFGGTTVRDVLERVPGLTGTSAYFTDRNMVAARGDQTKIDGGHTLILINGRPSREVLEGGITSDLLESFPLAALDRIEVIRGPGSVLYGSNAFTAVINLITSEVESTGFKVAGVGGGSGAYAASSVGTLACGDLKILASAQAHNRSAWSTPFRIPLSLVGDPLAPAVPQVQQTTIQDKGPGGFLQIRYKGVSAMGSLSGFQTSSFVRGSISRNTWGRAFGDLGYAFDPSSQWHSSVNLTFTRTTLDVPGFPYINRDAHESTLEWTNSLELTKATQVSFGSLYNHIEGREVYNGLGFPLPISSGDRSGSAVYGQVKRALSTRVHVIGGLQANKIGRLDLDVVPRGGMIVDVSPRVQVKALYSQAFRAPSINETTLDHPGLTGTRGLRPEKVGTFDLEWAYHGRRAQGSVVYFRSRQTDSINIDSRPARWVYRNLGEATFNGGEGSTKYFVHPNVLVIGSMLYQRSHDGMGNEHVTPVSSFGAKAGVSYQSSLLTLSLFDSYQGSLDGFSGTVAPTVNPSAAAYHMLSSHARFDVSSLFMQSRHGLAVVVQGNNLTNKQVWTPDWGGNSGDTLPAYGGRSLYVGVEIF